MIQFENVTKIYQGKVKANSNISFTLEPGEVLGIIGINGSGKSTLFRQLFGIISTTEGKIMVDGEENGQDKLAYVPQFPVIYPYLTVYESLETTLNYQGVHKKEAKKRIEELLRKLNLWELKNHYTYMLSGGQTKKLSFANAIIQKKKYLVLDEVTSMIDIVSKQEIWEQINKLKNECGILISSHDISEIKSVCDKILILKKGEVSYYGKIDDIYSKTCKITVRVDNLQKILNYLNEIQVDFEVKNFLINIYVQDIGKALKLMEVLEAQFEIKHLNCERPVFFEGVLKYV